MTSLSTVAKVQLRLEKTLDAGQTLLVEELLEQASSIVRTVLPPTWEGTNASVSGIVADMVARVMNASPEARSGFSQITTGPYGASISPEFVGATLVLRDHEREVLQAIADSSGAVGSFWGSINVGSPYA